MEINFSGEFGCVKRGVELLQQDLDFKISAAGIPVKVYGTDGDIEVGMKGGSGYIGYSGRIHFFRGLGLFIEGAKKRGRDFRIIERPRFDTDGVMVDASRNAVMKVDSIKKMIRIMSVMGLNMLMMYTEDTYDVKQYPYFGYMRGRYSYDELKECDDYADIFGIEMVPCIQALAHLTQALKWNYASGIRDTEDILLAGDEKTYEFVENMIKSASAPFRSRRIHIGMDEAHSLGLGRYLVLHGYRDRFGIMNEHLQRVIGITNRLGLRPMIWSDMFFRLGSKTGDYYDLNAAIPEEAIKRVPKELQLVYWDYYHHDKDTYLRLIRDHKAFGSVPVFAGGVWTWNGLCTNYKLTFANTNPALEACKEEGVKEVLATLWGDNGNETNVFTSLLGLQLFAEHGYADTVDEKTLGRRFEFCTGGKYDAFVGITDCDGLRKRNAGNDAPEERYANPSKYLLYQDVLLGLFDKDVEGCDVYGYYSGMEKRMARYSSPSDRWGFLFLQYQKLCGVLKLKGDIGVRIKRYYDRHDMEELSEITLKELPELYRRVDELRAVHRDEWMKVYKPFGWEVLDIRYGGVLAAIKTAEHRLEEYLAGRADRIEELEQDRLPFSDDPSRMPWCNIYTRIATASPL